MARYLWVAAGVGARRYAVAIPPGGPPPAQFTVASLDEAVRLVCRWLADLRQQAVGKGKRLRPACLSHGWALAREREVTGEWVRAATLRLRDPAPLVSVLDRNGIQSVPRRCSSGGWLVESQAPQDWPPDRLAALEEEVLRVAG
jgi:hypothetical protein